MEIVWQDMALFEGVDLNDSFVLGWSLDDNTASWQGSNLGYVNERRKLQ